MLDFNQVALPSFVQLGGARLGIACYELSSFLKLPRQVSLSPLGFERRLGKGTVSNIPTPSFPQHEYSRTPFRHSPNRTALGSASLHQKTGMLIVRGISTHSQNNVKGPHLNSALVAPPKSWSRLITAGPWRAGLLVWQMAFG